MHLCYIDESGTPDVPGTTSHYVLAGLSIPDNFWKQHKNLQAGHGLLIHDNNQAVARRHTELMKAFLQRGTLWTTIDHVIELRCSWTAS